MVVKIVEQFAYYVIVRTLENPLVWEKIFAKFSLVCEEDVLQRMTMLLYH